MEKIVYEPFKTLEEQEAFEQSLKEEIEQGLSESFMEGTDEDLKAIEEAEEKREILKGRLEERLINLGK